MPETRDTAAAILAAALIRAQGIKDTEAAVRLWRDLCALMGETGTEIPPKDDPFGGAEA